MPTLNRHRLYRLQHHPTTLRTTILGLHRPHRVITLRYLRVLLHLTNHVRPNRFLQDILLRRKVPRSPRTPMQILRRQRTLPPQGRPYKQPCHLPFNLRGVPITRRDRIPAFTIRPHRLFIFQLTPHGLENHPSQEKEFTPRPQRDTSAFS